MYIPEPYFKAVPSIGNVYLDYILIEDDYPILFTCTAMDYLYLCLCFNNYQEQNWYLTNITSEELKSLVSGDISFYGIFKHNKIGCSISWNPNEKKEFYDTMNSTCFLDENLPKDDVFFDKELIDEELEEYLDTLKDKFLSACMYCEPFNKSVRINPSNQVKVINIFTERVERCFDKLNFVLNNTASNYKWGENNVVKAC
ncbi:MAG: hypothetical protein MJ168_10535 [Clostridia bacterium]|nr:hypothetical protein [Clostridia bacterium]